jgi:hypothetical protein
MNYLKRIEDNFSFSIKIMVMLVAAVLIVAFVPAFYNSKNATNSNEIDTTTLENYLSNKPI